MDRRAFLGTVGLLAAPRAVVAQESTKRSEKVYRVGILHPSSGGVSSPWVDVFKNALQDLGYREGRNLALEYRWARAPEQFRDLATDLVQRKVDVILAASSPAALAAKNVAGTTPVVFVGVGDPVEAGLVDTLARPGGKVTGITHMAVDLAGKELSLLKEALPAAVRIVVLAGSSKNPTTALKLTRIEAAAQPHGVRVQVIDARAPSDANVAFADILRAKPDGLIALLDTIGHRAEITEFAAKNRLPAIYEAREFVDAGGLMSYGTSLAATYGRAAGYVDKILKGAKPVDLPVEQPTRFELVINLKTAKALGLTIPPSLLQRADQLIE